MEKKYIIEALTEWVKLYDKNLANKNVLFIYTHQKNKANLSNFNSFDFLETRFTRGNFQHLTGIQLVGKNGEILKNQSNRFYEKCMNGKLSPKDFIVKNKSTTILKLKALPMMVNIHKNAKMIGEYDELTKIELKTDKLVGGITVCVGFKKYKNLYVPNTLLKEDIRKVKLDATRVVVGICTKEINEDKYRNLTYWNKNYTLEELHLHEEVWSKISNYFT